MSAVFEVPCAQNCVIGVVLIDLSEMYERKKIKVSVETEFPKNA
jgi:hypothetical protein